MIHAWKALIGLFVVVRLLCVGVTPEEPALQAGTPAFQSSGPLCVFWCLFVVTSSRSQRYFSIQPELIPLGYRQRRLKSVNPIARISRSIRECSRPLYWKNNLWQVSSLACRYSGVRSIAGYKGRGPHIQTMKRRITDAIPLGVLCSTWRKMYQMSQNVSLGVKCIKCRRMYHLA